MHRAKPKTPLSAMEKRIPQNPKYKNTQSKIDTGTTVNKVRLISHKEFLKRRDESFRRVTCKCLAELFSEYEDGGSASPTEPEMVARMVKGSDGAFKMERVPAADADGNNSEHCSTARSSAGPRIVSYEADEKEDYDPPYLILDTRPREEFAVNRIHRAKSFPAAFLCRDYLLPEMHQFKNHESKLIILYDLDEKTVTQTAHTLVQRGFDNIYVLSGGMADYAEEFPDHIEGIPLPRRPGDPSKKAATSSTREVYKTAPSLTSTSSVAKSVKSAATRRKDTGSDVSSVMSTLSVAETVISKANARKARISGGGAANYR